MAAMIVSRLFEDGVVVTLTTTAAANDDSTFIYDKEKMIWDPLRIAEQMKSEDRYSLIDMEVAYEIWCVLVTSKPMITV
jgi:predicted lipoprotein with Yx(FWY)xxD motif